MGKLIKKFFVQFFPWPLGGARPHLPLQPVRLEVLALRTFILIYWSCSDARTCRFFLASMQEHFLNVCLWAELFLLPGTF